MTEERVAFQRAEEFFGSDAVMPTYVYTPAVP